MLKRVTLAAALLVCVAACRPSVRREAEALAGRGAKTGEAVGAYYESLARDTVDAWELTAFRRGFTQLPQPADDNRAAFERQFKALRARARLARRLGNVYEALGAQARYDAPAQLIDAVDDLEKELMAVVESPLDQPIEVAGREVGTQRDALHGVIRGIATWRESRDLKRGAQLLGETAARIAELFKAERELYRDISRDRAEKYRQVATALVESKEVVSAQLLDRVLESFDLRWPETAEPFRDERMVAAVRELLEARARTFEARAEDETDAAGRALNALADAHAKLAEVKW